MQAHLKIEDSITAINTPYHTIMGKFMLKCLFIIPLELLGQFYLTALSHFNESCLNAIQVNCAGCLSARPICSRSNQHCKAAQRHRLRVSGIESERHWEWVACHFHKCHKWSPRPECWKTSKFWKTKKFSRQRKINLKCQPKKFQKMKFISFLKDDLGHGTPLDNVKKSTNPWGQGMKKIFDLVSNRLVFTLNVLSAAICIEHHGAGRQLQIFSPLSR